MSDFKGIPAQASIKSDSKDTCQVYHVSLRYSPAKELNLSKDDLILGQPFLNNIIAPLCKKYIYQLEDTGSNLHFQGYLNLKSKVRPKTFAISLNEYFPGIEIRASSKAGILALQSYCMKAESRIAGPWADKRIYVGQDLPKDLFPFQQTVIDMCQKQPDDRTVNCIVDPKGNTGKSKLLKLLAFKYKFIPLCYAKTSDLINIAYQNQGAPGYIFDLTRVKPMDLSGNDIYSAMEQIKNGVIINTKYQTGVALFESPHVWVLMNHMPPMDKLTVDRWKIFSIDEKKNLVERTKN